MRTNKEQMTSLERLMAVLSLKEPDRVPVIPAVRDFAIRYAGYKLSECTFEAEKFIDAQIKCLNDFGYDGIMSWGSFPPLEEALGSKFAIFEDSPPALKEPFMKSKKDMEKLPRLDGRKSGKILVVLKGITELKRRIGPNIPLYAWVSSPFRCACMSRGLETLYMDIIDDPDFVKKLVEYFVEPSVEYATALTEAGADMIMVTNPVANKSCISKKHYQEFVFPFTRKMFSALKEKGIKIIYHICGDWSDRLDLVLEEGAHVLHVDKIDLSEAKKIMGEKVCLMGNIRSVETMVQGTPTKVEEESYECIRKAGKGGGYILSADCLLPFNTPPENVRAMVDAAKKWGNYPLDL